MKTIQVPESWIVRLVEIAADANGKTGPSRDSAITHLMGYIDSANELIDAGRGKP